VGVELSHDQVHALLEGCHDGNVSFDKFVRIVEKETSQKEMLTGSVNKILKRQQMKMLKLESEEERIIEEKTLAVCPQQHKLSHLTFAELEKLPFYFGYGGYVCGNCGVHSQHVVMEGCAGCRECEYIICDLETVGYIPVYTVGYILVCSFIA